MKLDRKTLHAIGNLAVRFWAHVFRRTFSKPKPGEELKLFKSNYADDLLVPLGCDERAALPEFQKCINCGACSAVCPVCAPVPEGFYRGPDSIASALSRSFPDLGSARDAIFNCTQCGACADVCPRGVNVPELVLFARRKTLQLKDSAATEIFGAKMNNLLESGNIFGANRTAKNSSAIKKGKLRLCISSAARGRPERGTPRLKL